MKSFEEIESTGRYLESKGFMDLDIVIILGTGLDKTINEIEILDRISTDEIPGFPSSTVSFHEGSLILGLITGKRCAIFQGRAHSYEGHSMDDIAFPLRVLNYLGAKHLIATGAAGCMNVNWSKGDIMLLKDHINLLPMNPLIGPNDDRIGNRFLDMSQAYDQRINSKCQKLSAQLGIVLRKKIPLHKN